MDGGTIKKTITHLCAVLQLFLKMLQSKVIAVFGQHKTHKIQHPINSCMSH